MSREQSKRNFKRLFLAADLHGSEITFRKFLPAPTFYDGDALLIGGLTMVSALQANHASVSLADVTPIARLMGEYEVIAVPAGSELDRLEDLVQALRINPGAVSWGGGSGGGADQLLINELARAIGVEPVRMAYVPFYGGEATQALLSHEVSVGVAGYAEFAPHMAAGRLRPLAISADNRLAGVPIPTMREQGIDITLVNWRGVFAPPAITDQQRQRLATVLDAMVRTVAWREALRAYLWKDLYLPDAAFARVVTEDIAHAASGPDPRGATPAGKPAVVWTSNMRLWRNRRLFASLFACAGLLVIGFIVWQRAAAARREDQLCKNLKAARQDASRSSAEAENLLRGLGDQIDRQFEAWALTPAEREVGLLLLKGLHHKEIASVRKTSERTVRQQALTLYKKAGLDGRTDLAAFFLEDLLLPAEPTARRHSA